MERKNKIITILVSVAAAIGLWLYVLTIVNPPTTVSIKQLPVALLGEDTLKNSGYAIADKGQYYVDISITGPRSEIEAALSNKNFHFAADVSGLNSGDNRVEVVASIAPKGITINDITPMFIDLSVDEYISESKNTKVFFSDPGTGYEETILKQEVNTINVRGAASDVKKVSYIKCNLPSDILVKDERKTVALTGIPVDAKGEEVKNVSMDVQGIELDAIIHTVKNVQFNVVLEGESLYGPDGIESFVAPTAITIKGTSADLAKVNVVLSQPINIDGVAFDRIYTITPDLPAGVILSRNQGSMTGSLKINEAVKAEYEAGLVEETDQDTTVDAQ